MLFILLGKADKSWTTVFFRFILKEADWHDVTEKMRQCCKRLRNSAVWDEPVTGMTSLDEVQTTLASFRSTGAQTEHRVASAQTEHKAASALTEDTSPSAQTTATTQTANTAPSAQLEHPTPTSLSTSTHHDNNDASQIDRKKSLVCLIS